MDVLAPGGGGQWKEKGEGGLRDRGQRGKEGGSTKTVGRKHFVKCNGCKRVVWSLVTSGGGSLNGNREEREVRARKDLRRGGECVNPHV